MGQPTFQARPGASLVAMNRLRLLSRKPTEADAAIVNPRHRKYLITVHCPPDAEVLLLALLPPSPMLLLPQIPATGFVWTLGLCWRRGFSGLACGQRPYREPPTPTPRKMPSKFFKSLGRCHLLPCCHVSTCSFLQIPTRDRDARWGARWMRANQGKPLLKTGGPIPSVAGPI